MRIAYCIESMAGHGGMERIISQKASYLTDKYGYDVDIITARQNGSPCPFPLSSKVGLVDLHIKFDQRNIRKAYKDWFAALKRHFYEKKYDIVISTGGKDLDFVHKIKDGSIKIAEFHFSIETIKFWAKKNYPGILGKILGIVKTVRTIINASKYEKFIVLSKTDCKKWSKYIDNCIYIYDFINASSSPQIYNPDIKKIITAGRHDLQKGYDYMIKAWAKVSQVYPDWNLYIYGGGNSSKTESYIHEYSLIKTVHIMGFSKDMDNAYTNASIFILSSRSEGFGLVIAEAQACGLPVVTFDTPIGPAEIVNNGIDGIVIKQGDTDSFAEAIMQLIESRQLRIDMSKKAIENASRFQKDKIIMKWVRLFNQLTNC